MILLSQQLEIRCSEARALVYQLYLILTREVSQENKIELFEAIAYPYLKSASLKISRRLAKAKPEGSFKITFSAQELIAIHQLLHSYPVDLLSFLTQIDCKVLNYDHIVEL